MPQLPTKRALSITTPILLFWALFWLTNGADKFLTDVDFVLFTWRGADWFAEYEEILGGAGMPEAVWRTLTVLAGLWEIALGILLAVALFARRIAGRDLAKLGVALSALVFAVFSAVDVVAGARVLAREDAREEFGRALPLLHHRHRLRAGH